MTVTAFPFEWTDKDISIRVMELSGLPCNQGMVRYRVCFEFDKQGTKSETENALRRKKSGKWLRQTPGRRQHNALPGPGKLLYMAVRDIGDLRAQNQPQVCPNFGDFRVQGWKNHPKVVRFGGFETDLGCFGPGPWTQII